MQVFLEVHNILVITCIQHFGGYALGTKGLELGRVTTAFHTRIDQLLGHLNATIVIEPNFANDVRRVLLTNQVLANLYNIVKFFYPACNALNTIKCRTWILNHVYQINGLGTQNLKVGIGKIS